MKYTKLASILSLATAIYADDSWKSLTPDTTLDGGITDMGSTTMGLTIERMSDTKVKRDVSSDGLDQHCSVDGNLAVTLAEGILYDSQGRVGAIVSNNQFQFDGPPPQSGSIYAAGWAVSEDGYLALGDSTQFYECLSGDFYNLYNADIADQCNPIQIKLVELIDC
ncbi:hypothetical protein CANARDRAFT_27134 [[Candida] arabinofermentans NRRL YB-2248]|uniref:Cell wall mannoprotein PIR1-like C-terminal domain-containing protein n=1 Tax=[Candida] arabinofermentans NRRL YB-2248 TaxID=983967 RepID=A0A1E4T4N5_9ASCO|nr:hypothetical protein CANARDRAFT_27134 [[Candida] arabinofermentans NRRL YB-2248]